MAVPLPAGVTLGSLAARHGGTLDARLEDLIVRALAPIDEARDGELAPVLARRYLRAAAGSPALLLVDAGIAANVAAGRRWIHPDAAVALTALLVAIAGGGARSGVHPRAVVEEGARIDPGASIGPGAVVMAGACIADGARVEPNAVVYGGVSIGARVCVGAGAVVGRPGFGWLPGAPPARIPQLGGVVVEEDVEIGALATVDAGTLSPTVIGRGAKLDAHVHVGHNARIGPGSIVAAQAGFAGSARVGAGVLVGGQAGVADHVRVGDGARLAAKAGVIGDVPPGATVAGYPAVDRARWLRAMARALASPAARRRSEEP